MSHIFHWDHFSLLAHLMKMVATARHGILALLGLLYTASRCHYTRVEAVFAEVSECATYIAPSTIPGAGLGFFTAVELQPNDVVGQGDVMIPMIDQWYHLQALGQDMARRDDWSYVDPTADYLWNGVLVGMHRETAHPNDEEYEFVSGYAPGMDAVINCHLALVNVDKNYPRYDFVGLHRSRDPGVGAFTPYYGCETFATETIPAGGELFKDYGDSWFMTREATFGELPLSNDYNEAEDLLESLHNILERRNVTEAARRDVWTLVTNLPWPKSRTIKAIPTESYDNLQLVAHRGIRAAYQPQATRSILELETTGRCADSIRPQPSTLRQAGRGAFTTRSFAAGQVVAGTPLLFFPSGANFDMYDGNWWTKSMDDLQSDEPPMGHQLLYNYCWHPEGNITSIYMCPYGSGVNYINHNQSRANVRLQWASHGEMNHDDAVLQSHPSSLFYTAAPRLWMDVVALRDIGTNEELFLDYGAEWENAWETHVKQWDDDPYPFTYMSAYDWNVRYPDAILRTVDEQYTDPYPDNFVLTCLPHITIPAFVDELTGEEAQALWAPSVVGIPCRIIERDLQEDGEYWYLVEYHELEYPVPLSLDDDEYDIEWQESHYIVREAMRFQETPYSNNLSLDKAFRHPIGFPLDLFPSAWKSVFLPPLPPKDSAVK